MTDLTPGQVDVAAFVDDPDAVDEWRQTWVEALERVKSGCAFEPDLALLHAHALHLQQQAENRNLQLALERGGREMAELEFGADHPLIDKLARGAWYGWLHPEETATKPKHTIPEQQATIERLKSVLRRAKLIAEEDNWPERAPLTYSSIEKALQEAGE